MDGEDACKTKYPPPAAPPYVLQPPPCSLGEEKHVMLLLLMPLTSHRVHNPRFASFASILAASISSLGIGMSFYSCH